MATKKKETAQFTLAYLSIHDFECIKELIEKIEEEGSYTDHMELEIDGKGILRFQWFKNNVSGLDAQLDDAAGYVSYPGIGQYGILIGGGKFGRGVVFDSTQRQVGWAYLNTVSAAFFSVSLIIASFLGLVVFIPNYTARAAIITQRSLLSDVGRGAYQSPLVGITLQWSVWCLISFSNLDVRR